MWYPQFLFDLEINIFILGPSFSNMIYPFICLLSYPELIYKKSNRISPIANNPM
jgi:hypothetical protein